uniref:Uncharacterized protein n=1 Tax=Arundo donax TaxID=35708 RepID=A0A0A9GJM5_ARUDO
MTIRPVVPKAAWPMSGYVSRPSLLSRQQRRSTPVYHASRANKQSITRPSQPPCLMAYGVDRIPTPHRTFIPFITPWV